LAKHTYFVSFDHWIYPLSFYEFCKDMKRRGAKEGNSNLLAVFHSPTSGWLLNLITYQADATHSLFTVIYRPSLPTANNESSEVIDILLPVTFYFIHSTRLDNVKNRPGFIMSKIFVISLPTPPHQGCRTAATGLKVGGSIFFTGGP